MVRMTFKDLVDRFVERNNLAIALLQSNMSWPLAIEKKFNDYYQRAQGHIDMMTYDTGLEFLKFLLLLMMVKVEMSTRLLQEVRNVLMENGEIIICLARIPSNFVDFAESSQNLM